MSADLALLAADPTALDVYDDPGQQIVLACERAKAWLRVATDENIRIETIVEVKAQAAALAAFAVQKQLGKDAELAALEVQRRAERGTALAVRRGQETGDIRTAGQHERAANQHGESAPSNGFTRSSPGDFFTHNVEREAAYQMADGVSEDQFEEAIADAKTEGNLSRANVVRKVKGEKNGGKLTGEKRLDVIRTRAATGYTSSQIADELGHTPDYVRQLCRDNDIEVLADRVMNRTAGNRRVDSTRIARETVMALDAVTPTLRLINYIDIDPSEAREWATSLTESIRVLNRFAKQIKEIAQ